MNQKDIGKFISELRKSKKITQEELAEKLGVNNRTISRWKNGNNMPDVSIYKPLCDELNITINELLSGKKLSEKEYQEKLEETYYEDNSKIIGDSGSSIPYKITVEKSDDEYLVLEVEIPRDGSDYAKDMKSLFPKAVRNDMNKVHNDGTIEKLQLDIDEQKDNYYNK
jgi:transcriptional regulator with XRE-family HTH domain